MKLGLKWLTVKTNRSFSSHHIAVLTALWLTVAYNWVLNQQILQWANHVFEPLQIGLNLLLFLINLILISLFTYKRSFMAASSLLFIVSAGSLYFMHSYGIVISKEMITNVAETDVSEVSEIVNSSMMFYILVLGVLPVWLLHKISISWQPGWKQLKANTIRIACSIAAITVILISHYSAYASMFRQHREIKYLATPLNVISASLGYVNKHAYAMEMSDYQDITSDAEITRTNHIPRLLVMVVGETARADHFGLNGYAKNTTPYLSQKMQNKELISFTQATSCGTATAVSVPCMFSYLTEEQYQPKEAKSHSNVLDVLQTAGYQVLWVDNNSGCKSMCDRAPTIEVEYDATKADCQSGKYCYDTILNRILADKIESVAQDTVIVLHMVGSHGPEYFKRSPENLKNFKPECLESRLDHCTSDSINNAYDNSILVTDKVLNDVIELLKKQPQLSSSMLYVSDHGESLGENGIYLHGLPTWLAPETQRHVPWLMWQSDEQLDWQCMQSRANDAISHDNLFHTLLGMAGVSSHLYQSDLDLTQSCRQN
ncbi:phosphoethanolamine transferase [Neptunicella marina]|uniref:Phosphoethanolamine--lipid A transferase n=1 Tax=Neptunicella marina TaxID=2125989 RepID=A0A8J6M3Y8_9ALTE|nr:phosphoethanolamine--lipid A transferase [Neptunicella marina]MBC3767557.1 phosphoethanolamine--lipid A transferase [Neptunicella marina]